MTNNDEVIKEINKVLAYQHKELNDISKEESISEKILDERISKSEELLKSLGRSINFDNVMPEKDCTEKIILVPNWSDLYSEAEKEINDEVSIESLFTEEELEINEEYIKQLNEEFNCIHKLDKFDYTICAVGALLASLIDILLIDIPSPSPDGVKAGSLANHVRVYFEKKYPAEELKNLANSYKAKVPFDLQNNTMNLQKMVDIDIDGLSTYYHRLLSVGHDPLLGFLFGVLDILNGTMTTIDKKGNFVCQVVKYADIDKRVENNIIDAIMKQITHLKTDITTDMGLPAPLMELFNFLQIGEIGEDKQTIAEIAQGMYYEGFDFIHFCSQSISVIVLEIFVRTAYSIKRVKEGYTIKESIPVSLNREKHPKIATMLFIAHSGTAAVNAGKIYFTKNPMAINYAEWLAYTKYIFSQLKWVLLDKPNMRSKYIDGILNEGFEDAYNEIDLYINESFKDYTIVFDKNAEI